MAACVCGGAAHGAGGVDKKKLLAQVSGSGVPIDDSLILAEVLDWYTSKHMQEVEDSLCQIDEASSEQIDAHFTATTLRLFVFFGRTFIVQLLYAIAEYDFDKRVGKDEYRTVLGCVRFLHQELCRCDDLRFSNLLDLNDVLELCLEEVGKEFEEFFREKHVQKESVSFKLGSRSKRRSTVFEELEKPCEIVASKIKATTTKNNLEGKGNSTENYNYRSAYTMMVGLDASIRLKGAMKLYRISVFGIGRFASELRADLVDQGLNVFAEASLRKTYAEAQMSTDAVLLCLSAVALKLNLPSAGCPFSRKHLLGDDENLWLEEYAPMLFGECRKVFNISEDEYKKSVSRTGFSFIEFASNSKSGEMFFFSWDGKYIIKTISEKEVYVLIKMLPKYLQHITKPSLLMRICGLYRVSVSEEQAPRYFLIAISVFDAGDMGLHHQFDLKGSTVNRLAKEEESVHKDLNWLRGHFQVNLPAGLKRSVAAALENDANFLKEQSVLDYSVLVGIHDRESKVPGKQNRGVRLLQGIVKQKIPPGIKSLLGKQRSNVSRSSTCANIPSGSMGATQMSWLNSTAKSSPVHTSIARMPSEDSASSKTMTISRLPSCTSDPYDKSEIDADEDLRSDEVDMFPAVDAEQEEWQRLKAWLPSLPDQMDVAEVEEATVHWRPELRVDTQQPRTRLADISENSPLRIGMSLPSSSGGDSPEIQTLVQELDELSRLGRFGTGRFGTFQDAPHNRHVAIEEHPDIPATRYSFDNKEKTPGPGRGQGPGSVFVPLSAGSAARLDSLTTSWCSGTGSSNRDPFAETNGAATTIGSASPVARADGLPANSVKKSLMRSTKAKQEKGQGLLVFNDADDEKGWTGLHGPISAGDCRGEHGRYVYYIGIIDFLIPWDAKKKGEYALNCCRGRGTRASCVPPTIYAERQIDFVLRSMMGLFNAPCAKKYAAASVTLPPPKIITYAKGEDEKNDFAKKEDGNKDLGNENHWLATVDSLPLASDVVTKYGTAHTNEDADTDTYPATRQNADAYPATRKNQTSEEELIDRLNLSFEQRRQNLGARRERSGHDLCDVGQDKARPETDTSMNGGDIETSLHSAHHARGMASAASRTGIDSDTEADCSGMGSNHAEHPDNRSSSTRQSANGTHASARDKTSLSLASTVGQENGEQTSQRGSLEVGALDLDFATGDANEEGDDPSVFSTAPRSPFGPEPEAQIRAPPTTPAPSAVRRQKEVYVSKLQQAQADTQQISSQVASLMAALDQAKKNAAVVMSGSQRLPESWA